MRTRTRPESRSWRAALRCLLALYLAGFVGGGRLLGLAHLALSEHRHAFCEEHGRFEDLPRADNSARRAAPNHVATEQDRKTAGASDVASTFRAHSACLFLNGRTFQAPIHLAEQESTVAPEACALEQASPRQDGVVVGLLLHWAPKTSPPFVAA